MRATVGFWMEILFIDNFNGRIEGCETTYEEEDYFKHQLFYTTNGSEQVHEGEDDSLVVDCVNIDSEVHLSDLSFVPFNNLYIWVVLGNIEKGLYIIKPRNPAIFHDKLVLSESITRITEHLRSQWHHWQPLLVLTRRFWNNIKVNLLINNSPVNILTSQPLIYIQHGITFWFSNLFCDRIAFEHLIYQVSCFNT